MFIKKEKRRKRKVSEDSPPDIPQVPPMTANNGKSKTKRRSFLSPISEDAFGTPSALVAFEESEKGSYGRVRLGSEEATIASSVMSDSPNSSPTRSLFPHDNGKET
jgi:hypothetical protein